MAEDAGSVGGRGWWSRIRAWLCGGASGGAAGGRTGRVRVRESVPVPALSEPARPADGGPLPKVGDVFELTEAWETVAIWSSDGPFSGDVPCVLPAGERLRVAHAPNPRATHFFVLAEDYAGCEARVIPESLRTSRRYTGISFCLAVADIGGRVRRVVAS